LPFEKGFGLIFAAGNVGGDFDGSFSGQARADFAFAILVA
jgi:hypothetical protein